MRGKAIDDQLCQCPYCGMLARRYKGHDECLSCTYMLNKGVTPQVGKKYCPDCETFKDRSDFGNNRGSTDGLTAYCKKCKSKRKRNNSKRAEYFKDFYEKTFFKGTSQTT